MRPGVIACSPDTPLSEVAETMCSRHVHALAVAGVAGPAAIIISDLDVIGALATADDLAVHQVAMTEAVTAPRDAPLREAAQVMAEHGVSHLIVLDEANGRPVGVLSTTDILAAYSAAAHRPTSA